MIQFRLSRLEKHIAKTQALLQKIYNRRLFAGLLTFMALVVAAFFRENVVWSVLGFFVGPAIFTYYFIYSNKIRSFDQSLQAYYDFLFRQKLRLEGKTPEILEENQPDIPPSAHSTDLDLFTAHGLFYFLDETFTPGGQKKFIQELLQPWRTSEEISLRQKEIKSLSRHHWFLTRLLIDGKNSRDFKGHSEQLLDFIQRPFLEKGFHRDYFILKVLFVLAVLGFINGLTHWLPGLHPLFFLGLHFVYSLIAAGNLKGVFERAHNMALQLFSLMPVMKRLETKADHPDFKQHLKGLKSFSPNRRMKALNLIISCLSIQGHPLIFIAVNGLCPWSFFFAKRLERQRQDMMDLLPHALEDLYDLEVLVSLVTLYRHQTQTFAAVSETPHLEFESAFHPLIAREKVVANSFHLKPGTHLNLITGSNMSGKSSFLRTVGVNHILFLMGAPVFAKSYKTYPFQLATCIRVTDALDDGISYFYAEVLRLKEIVTKAKDSTPILYLIDEIFKGTNNRERLIGSKSVLELLAESPSIGFVTTHDLELTQLAEQFPLVTNWHFRDDVENGEMVFNYRIQSGPCPTTNALKIMKMAGLPVKD